MSEPEISVVVASRDRAERLRLLLDSLAAQELDPGAYEVVVVDDGSRDGTQAAIASAAAPLGAPLVSLRAAGEGPAKARNAGWRAARAPLIAFTDDDCEATPGWLAALLAEARRHPGEIVQGLTAPNPRELRQLGPLSRTKSITGPTPYFQTCNILYPRELLERLEGFDESFPEPAGEDSDLGWRALELGAKRVFAPTAVVHHAIEQLSPRGFLEQALRGGRSAHVYRRHPELRRQLAYAGIFWNRANAYLLLAVAGVAASRRRPLALLLVLPWLKTLAGRSRYAGAAWMAPLYAAYDVLDAYKSIRASLENRILLL